MIPYLKIYLYALDRTSLGFSNNRVMDNWEYIAYQVETISANLDVYKVLMKCEPNEWYGRESILLDLLPKKWIAFYQLEDPNIQFQIKVENDRILVHSIGHKEG